MVDKASEQRRQPSRDPEEREEWRETYSSMIVTPERAVEKVYPGQRVFLGTAAAMPLELVRALIDRAEHLPDLEILNLLMAGGTEEVFHELTRHFGVEVFYVSTIARSAIQKGLADYVPVLLSDIPELFATGRIPVDVALIQVSPPDERGLCSLGVSVDVVKSAAANAAWVIAQVNPQMPRTKGDSLIDVFEIDALVPVDAPLFEWPESEPDEKTARIAELVAALIEDGSTLELGIGSIPRAIAGSLGDKKDLGIHTEIIWDSYVDLVEQGVVTGARKSFDRGQVVGSFCLGTKHLYDHIGDNPGFALHPTEYVNDPNIISRQHKMVAVNGALEVDLTGQVCTDSLGTRFFSGIGGQADFNRGAARADHGKAIVVLHSTADGMDEGGEGVSRIVTTLSPGSGVVTTRGDTHYVVTEYGVAYLHGKNIQERSLSLISIAHPQFRDQLLREAIEAGYIRPELADLEGRIAMGPRELSTRLLLPDGSRLTIRPANPNDAPQVKELFYSLSRETVYSRFMQYLGRAPEKAMQNLVYIDHRNEVSIVAALPQPHGDEIIAVAGYYLDPSTNRAEVAFLVRDEWQNRGIGTFILRHLINIAKRNGIAGFYGESLQSNRAMQAILRKSGYKVSSHFEGGTFVFEVDFV